MLQTLLTPAGEHLPDVPWQVYPPPQFRRDRWLNLNGWWDFAVTEGDAPPARFPGKIRLPFCPKVCSPAWGSILPRAVPCGTAAPLPLPDDWAGAQLALHIGAADQVLDAWVNGMAVGSHTGGYEAMTFGVTGAWRTGANEILLRVRDDLRSTVLPYGKQVQQRGGMWYTPVSGVWQTVWLEPLPPYALPGLTVTADDSRAILDTGDATQQGTVTVHTPDGPLTVPLQNGRAEIRPARPRLWCPADPYLYECTCKPPTDRWKVTLPCANFPFKKRGATPGSALNGRPLFFHGCWTRGISATGCSPRPRRNATSRTSGCCSGWASTRCANTSRWSRTIFTTSATGWAWWSFRIWSTTATMPTGGTPSGPPCGCSGCPTATCIRTPATRAAFLDGMRATVRQLYNHPCVCYWTIFNEGWGQFDATAVYQKLRALDSSRSSMPPRAGSGAAKPTWTAATSIMAPGCCAPASGRWSSRSSAAAAWRWDGHRANPDKSYGYSTATDRAALQQAITGLYLQKVLPAVGRGLCAAIYTQLSDVEDEINGLVTYDRRVVKPDAAAMGAIADELQAAFAASCAGKSH